MLVTKELTRYFGEVHAVDKVDFHVDAGEIVSLVGPNGAGKTTLVNLISGFLSPDSGKIFLHDRDITRDSVVSRIKRGIARSFQLVNIYDQLPVLDNIRIPVLSRTGKSWKMFSLLEREEDVRKEALQILELFGLRENESTPARDLSHGDRKLLDVAIAFALRPKLLLLDEPTSGVSTSEKAVIMDQIVAAIRTEKISAVIVEHDMDVVFRYSDRVVVMHNGRILAKGKPEEVRQNEDVKSTLFGGVEIASAR